MAAIKPQNPLNLRAVKCTTGCSKLDALLAGGVPCGLVTELVGESTAGKTQLCLQLVLTALLPKSLGGISSSSLYIHSEFPFPLRRLDALSRSFSQTTSCLPDPPLDHILVRGVHSATDLLAVLDRVHFLMSGPSQSSGQLPIGLIVIDSIAALFRADFDCNAVDMRRRSGMFFAIAVRLKHLASRFGVAIVVTNQVMDILNEEKVRVGNYEYVWSSGRKVGAALGLGWGSCVNVRLFLSKTASSVMTDDNRRKMMVVFGPHLAKGSCEFVIRRHGVFGIS